MGKHWKEVSAGRKFWWFQGRNFLVWQILRIRGKTARLPANLVSTFDRNQGAGHWLWFTWVFVNCMCSAHTLCPGGRGSSAGISWCHALSWHIPSQPPGGSRLSSPCQALITLTKEWLSTRVLRCPKMGFNDIVHYDWVSNSSTAFLLFWKRTMGTLTSVALLLLFASPECPWYSNIPTQTPPLAHVCEIHKHKNCGKWRQTPASPLPPGNMKQKNWLCFGYQERLY